MTPIRSPNGCSPLKRRTILRRLVSLALLLTANSAIAIPQAPTLVFAVTENIDSHQGVWLEKIYSEALRRIGYRLVYQHYPVKRASALADSGSVDGEIHRAKSYGVVHPNLVQVPAPHFSSSFAAYGLPPLSLSSGWKSLGTAQLRVEYRAGVVYCEQMLPPVVPAERLSTVYGINLGLRKLLHRRTDIYVDEERFVDLMLQNKEFKDSKIQKLAIIDTVDAYAFLNRRHRKLAPQLAEALNAMKREGLIERYREQAYGEKGKTL
jgi:hypothetical protein